jgi:predicted RNA-binding protein YlqC (UPF0109 family)
MVELDDEQQNKRPLEDEASEGSNKRVRTGEEPVEVCLLVKSNDMGQVIGKGGETIKSIRAESGASVYTSKYISNIDERTAKISGTIEQVCIAIRMIIDIVSKGQPAVNLLAEYRNLGALIGKQGANIKKIREETGAKIFVTKECKGNSSQKEIQITGEYDCVTQAVEIVVGYLADGKNPTRIPYVPGDMGGYALSPTAGFNPLLLSGGSGLPVGMMTQGMGFESPGAPSVCRIETTMYVPKEVIGHIIGRGGANIKEVRMRSAAHVFVDAGEDSDETPERKITIKGKRHNIDVACRMIENLVAQRQ